MTLPLGKAALLFCPGNMTKCGPELEQVVVPTSLQNQLPSGSVSG